MTVYSIGPLWGFAKKETHHHTLHVPYSRTVDGAEVFGETIRHCYHYDIPDAMLSRALAAGATTTECELGDGNE